MGINEQQQLKTHPLRGNLFENMIVMEILKQRYNKGLENNITFYRDHKGNEVDVIYNIAQHLLPIEIKSGQTVTKEYFKGLQYFEKLFPDLPYGKAVIYGGDQYYRQEDTEIVHFLRMSEYFNKFTH